jgi:hypothetical protein
VNVFETNALKLEKLRERVAETFRKRGEDTESISAWHEATRAFHSAYDELAFPGGLNREFELLNAGDSTAIEMGIQFLEADPRYFRSGYHKEDILKILRKHALNADQCKRMRKLIVDHVRGRPTREMRAYARFAPTVTTPQFEAEIVSIAHNANRNAARHAQWVTECLKSSKKSSIR